APRLTQSCCPAPYVTYTYTDSPVPWEATVVHTTRSSVTVWTAHANWLAVPGLGLSRYTPTRPATNPKLYPTILRTSDPAVSNPRTGGWVTERTTGRS